MTGKVLDNSANGILVLLIPIAFAIIFVHELWPLLLVLIILNIAWRVWQYYQWQEWSRQVNPYFNDLIKKNRGCLTPVDLALKANLPARSARTFLAKKAEEYGAQRKIVKDRGEVFYFLTAGALNTIFEDSEPPSTEEHLNIQQEEEEQYSPIKTPKFVESLAEAKKPEKLSIKGIAQLAKQEQKLATIAKETEADSPAPSKETSETKVATETKKEINPISALIQADLAKRLDLNSSTVGRRKSKPDFPEWSQSKDPEGVAWKYLKDKELFVPADTD